MSNDDDSLISAFLMGFRKVRGLILKRFDISSKILTSVSQFDIIIKFLVLVLALFWPFSGLFHVFCRLGVSRMNPGCFFHPDRIQQMLEMTQYGPF